MKKENIRKFIPNYWVRNIDKLRKIVADGTVYIDLVFNTNFYSIMISSVKYNESTYKDNSLELFVIYENKDVDSLSHRAKKLGSFIEPSTVACMLTIQGYEVYFGKETRFFSGFLDDDEFEYVPFGEVLESLQRENEENFDPLDEKLGGAYGGERPYIYNGNASMKISKRKPIDEDLL